MDDDNTLNRDQVSVDPQELITALGNQLGQAMVRNTMLEIALTKSSQSDGKGPS